MPRSAPLVTLSIGDREEIQGWLTAHGTPQQVGLRSRIVLAAAEGRSDSAIACQLQVNRHTVILWRQRFLQEGKESLWEVAPGRGRKPTYGPEKIQAIVKATLQTKPKGTTQWSCRLMAENQGLSKSTVSNIWRSHNLKPHRVKTFKLSRDPQFLEKLTDVVGLYLNPPEKAVVLCVDEEIPGDIPLHLVMDNYGTHKHPRTVAWLKRHPRFISHFVPTSSSWLNLIERWFAELTSKRVRRGSFFSVDDLQRAITDFLNAWNEEPKPFVWTATVESIQAKLSRCRQTLEQIQPGCTKPRTRKRPNRLSS